MGLINPTQHIHDHEGRNHAQKRGYEHGPHDQKKQGFFKLELKHGECITPHGAKDQRQCSRRQCNVETPAKTVPKMNFFSQYFQIFKK